jgi:formamidopyrimidine-DNA glycosylase
MPELPEVQTVVNDLVAAGLCGLTITGVQIFWPGSIACPAPQLFSRQLIGQRLTGIRRRAKYIVFDFAGGGNLFIHLRMTGRLHLSAPEAQRSKHEHVILSFNAQRQLRLHDTRKFGRFYFVPEAARLTGKLGPEPLEPDFTADVFTGLVRSRRRQLKPLLLDQTFIAGLGNIYADEALWQARLHPCRQACSLSRSEARALHRGIVSVLQRGIINLGTTLGEGRTNFYSVGRRKGGNSRYLKVFRRTGLPCPRCRTPVQRILVGQRSTHICPRCQVP